MKRLLAIGFFLCAPLAFAAPQINVGVVYDYLDADKSTYLKRIFNGGDSTAFIKINILEMLFDEQGTAREIPLQSQAGATARDGLMASPARLIVPANGTQGTRLLYMGARDQERYFRVRFVPVVPEAADEFALTDEEQADYKKDFAAGVTVLAGYGTVFFVRPKDTRFDTKVVETADQYTLRNAGNSVVVLDEFRDCSAAKKTDCEATTKHHILPGRQWQLEKKPGREYRFQMIEGRDKTPMTVNSNG